MLQDRFGRSISYLRVSVTDRCDLRCSYCMPKGFSGFEEPAHWLTFDEMTRLIGLFAQVGVGRVRLTGGEPLLRKDLPLLAARIAALPGIRDLSLSTNATQLEKHAVALKAAGVSRINVSLDSLEKACLEDIVGKAAFERIMAGIMAGKAVGFDPIKINMVAMRGVNDHEIENMAAFCLQNGFILRLIEAMPMGDTGRNAQYMPLDEVRDSLVARLGLEPEALGLGGGGPRVTGKPATVVAGLALLHRFHSTSVPPVIEFGWRSMARSICAWGRRKSSLLGRCLEEELPIQKFWLRLPRQLN